MPSGGHSRSGPPAQPGSERSERRGFKLSALPNEGYSGTVPDLTDYLPKPSKRHLLIWSQLWATPQACAWSLESWRWPVVADLVKYMVRSEADDAPVGLGTVVRQLRDDCGLSKVGLSQNGWSIAADEVAAKASDPTPAPKPAATRRLRSVDAGS